MRKKGLRGCNRNIQDGISVIQTYEALSSDILKRQRELAVQPSKPSGYGTAYPTGVCELSLSITYRSHNQL